MTVFVHRHFTTHCSFNLICLKTKAQLNLLLADFTGWLKSTSLNVYFVFPSPVNFFVNPFPLNYLYSPHPPFPPYMVLPPLSFSCHLLFPHFPNLNPRCFLAQHKMSSNWISFQLQQFIGIQDLCGIHLDWLMAKYIFKSEFLKFEYLLTTQMHTFYYFNWCKQTAHN